MKKDAQKHFSFEEEPSAVGKGLGRVAEAFEKTEEAVATVGSKIASYVPGTAEHALRKGKQELKATGDIHLADGSPISAEIAFEKGPASHPATLDPSAPPSSAYTADDLAFVKEGHVSVQNNVSAAPKAAMRTADDLAFTRGGGGATVTQPQPQPHGLNPRTADEAAFKEAGGAGAVRPAPTAEVLDASRGPTDKLHTADDMDFGGVGR